MIFKVNKTKDYTIMANYHLRDKRLNWKEKGIMSTMLSLPTDWDYSISGLITLSADGKDSTMKALSKLELLGYLVRDRVVDNKGRFVRFEYNIYEYPKSENPYAENPYAEKPNTEKPNTEKPPQLNTNKLNTNKLNTNILNTNLTNKKENIYIKEKRKNKKESNGSFDAIVNDFSNGNEELKSLIFEWIKVRKLKRAVLTNRALKMNLGRLKEFAEKSHLTEIDYLKEVIMRGWVGFFVLGGNGKNKNLLDQMECDYEDN